MSLAQGNNTPTRPRIEPGSPDPESDALTIRPVRPRNCIVNGSYFRRTRYEHSSIVSREYRATVVQHVCEFQVNTGPYFQIVSHSQICDNCGELV